MKLWLYNDLMQSFFKKTLIYLLFILCFFIFGIEKSFSEYKAPKPVGYVNDFANVLSQDSKSNLNSIIAELKSKTGAEVVVVTLKTLEGYMPEDVGLAIGRQWKVGEKDKNNGVIILTAITDRKLRIEVGYGIEPYLTDAQAGRIRDGYMIPYFKKGDYQSGIVYGTAAVVSTIAKGYDVTVSGNYKLPPAQDEPDGASIVFLLILMFLFIRYPSFMAGFMFNMMLGGRGYTGGGGFGGGSSFGGFGGSGGFGGGGASGRW